MQLGLTKERELIEEYCLKKFGRYPSHITQWVGDPQYIEVLFEDKRETFLLDEVKRFLS